MEQKLSVKQYGPRSRILVALIIAFGSYTMPGRYGNFLDWIFAVVLAISIIFEEERWAEYTCWVAIVGRLGGIIKLFSNSKFDWNLENLLVDTTITGAPNEFNDGMKLEYRGLLLLAVLVILYVFCLAILHILIPRYLGRHYLGLGGIVFSTVMLVISIVVVLAMIFLTMTYVYLKSMVENAGMINSSVSSILNLNFSISDFVMVLLNVVSFPLGARLYFGLCRKHPEIELKNSLANYTNDNFKKHASEKQVDFENPEEGVSNKRIRYCSHCGKELVFEAVVCPNCGCPVENYKEIQRLDAPSTGLNVLSFFVPLAGLIIYLMDKDRMPQRACGAGKWALIGVGVSIGLIVLYSMMAGAIVASFY